MKWDDMSTRTDESGLNLLDDRKDGDSMASLPDLEDVTGKARPWMSSYPEESVVRFDIQLTLGPAIVQIIPRQLRTSSRCRQWFYRDTIHTYDPELPPRR